MRPKGCCVISGFHARSSGNGPSGLGAPNCMDVSTQEVSSHLCDQGNLFRAQVEAKGTVAHECINPSICP